MTRSYRLFLYLFLSVLSGFGPLVTDMYLPALPKMSGYFSTNDVMVQLSLTFCMVGLAIGQLIIGPLSDKLGRSLPLRASLFLFLIATLGCIFAGDIVTFLLFRLLQGCSGAGGIVLSRSTVRDLFDGKEMTKVYGIITAVHSLAPMLSPVCGSVLLEAFEWKSIFVFLFFLGCLLVVLSFCFREPLPQDRRLNGSPWATFGQILHLFRNKSYVLYVLLQGCTFGIMFSYIASSPYIIQDHYGQSSIMFGVWFAVNAMTMACGGLLLSRFSNIKIALRLGCFFGVLMAVLTAIVLYADGPFWMYEGGLFLMLFSMSLIMPSTAILAMNAERDRAGSASAVLGAVLFVVGGIVSPLVGMGNILHSTATVFLVFSALLTIMAIYICYRPYYRALRMKR